MINYRKYKFLRFQKIAIFVTYALFVAFLSSLPKKVSDKSSSSLRYLKYFYDEFCSKSKTCKDTDL